MALIWLIFRRSLALTLLQSWVIPARRQRQTVARQSRSSQQGGVQPSAHGGKESVAQHHFSTHRSVVPLQILQRLICNLQGGPEQQSSFVMSKLTLIILTEIALTGNVPLADVGLSSSDFTTSNATSRSAPTEAIVGAAGISGAVASRLSFASRPASRGSRRARSVRYSGERCVRGRRSHSTGRRSVRQQRSPGSSARAASRVTRSGECSRVDEDKEPPWLPRSLRPNRPTYDGVVERVISTPVIPQIERQRRGRSCIHCAESVSVIVRSSRADRSGYR